MTIVSIAKGAFTDLVHASSRRRRRIAQLRRIRTDIEQCGAYALELVSRGDPTPHIQSVPGDAWTSCGAELRDCGVLTEGEYASLASYFEAVRQLNLALSRASSAYAEIHENRSAMVLLMQPLNLAAGMIKSNPSLHELATGAVSAGLSRLER